MQRSALEQYEDILGSLRTFNNIPIFTLARLSSLEVPETKQFVKEGRIKGHIFLDEKHPKLSEKGKTCFDLWLGLRKFYKLEKVVSSIHDLDTEPFNNMTKKILESDLFKQIRTDDLNSSVIFYRRTKVKRCFFEIYMDFLRSFKKYPKLNYTKITGAVNVGTKILNRLTEIALENGHVQVEETSAKRYVRKNYFLKPEGISCINTYDRYLKEFELNGFLNTYFKPLNNPVTKINFNDGIQLYRSTQNQSK
jgi:predicted transcriptional regulator